mgnify:CR=1 FL=1
MGNLSHSFRDGLIRCMAVFRRCCWMRFVHGWFCVNYRLPVLRPKVETRYMKPISTNDSHIVLRASIKEVKRNIILVDAAIYNNKEELCTKALCTYFTFSQEKAKRRDAHFLHCDVESDEQLPLI